MKNYKGWSDRQGFNKKVQRDNLRLIPRTHNGTTFWTLKLCYNQLIAQDWQFQAMGSCSSMVTGHSDHVSFSCSIKKRGARLSASQNLCWCVEAALLFHRRRETAFWVQNVAQLCIRSLPNHDHRDLRSGAEESDEEIARGRTFVRNSRRLWMSNDMPRPTPARQHMTRLVDNCDELLQA